MNRHEMIKRINTISDLPTLPTVAMELNRMLKSENTPIEKVTELLESDQSMTLKILRLVNSSFYGFRSQINSLRHAITLLGYNTVQHAVVTVAVIDCLKVNHALAGLDISRFWTHSISVATLCRHMAARTKLAAPEEAFTAGLVHDIGKVVLANYFTDTFVSLSSAAADASVTFYAAEKCGDTYPHNLIGSNLARRWMLPEPLELAIRHHHGGGLRSGDGALYGLVAAADTLVNVMDQVAGHTLGSDAIPEAVREPVLQMMKDSEQWFPAVKREMVAACEFFNQR